MGRGQPRVLFSWVRRPRRTIDSEGCAESRIRGALGRDYLSPGAVGSVVRGTWAVPAVLTAAYAPRKKPTRHGSGSALSCSFHTCHVMKPRREPGAGPKYAQPILRTYEIDAMARFSVDFFRPTYDGTSFIRGRYETRPERWARPA